MKRDVWAVVAAFALLVVFGSSAAAGPTIANGASASGGPDSLSSGPPDTTTYAPAAPAFPRLTSPVAPVAGVFTTDPSVSASSAGGSEPSIAVNPTNPDEIAITRFTFPWNSNADFLYSTDGGITWTNEATIPAPPGVNGTSGGPFDQTIDFGRDGTLYGTFLTCVPNGSGGCSSTSVVTGSTADPTQATSWMWNGNPAQLTSGSRTNVDQPWLLVNRNPTTQSQDDVYVAYDDFGGNPDARVAVSRGATPVNITVDNIAGTESPLATNPGLRLAADPRNGTMYALYETSTDGTSGTTQPKSVSYMLNRSTDGGATWTLNGSSNGLTVDTVNSDQAPGFKFGTVNALLGGVDHVAVDPSNGDVYVVYGQDVSGGNQIEIRRLTDNGSGGLNVAAAHDVSTSTDAALPSVAVLSNGTVGVLYMTYDGMSSGLPTFSAHLARSTDQGATFSDVVLQSFSSPASNNGNARQRVLGDYIQMKAVGDTFYGVFSGNRNGFGSTTSAIDPIFFKVPGPTTVTYTGPTSEDYNDSFTASGTLTTAVGAPLSGKTLTFSLGAGTGTETCSASTDSTGTAQCQLTPFEAAGSYTLTASFAGDGDYVASSDSVAFTITKEETTLQYTGPTVFPNAQTVQFSAVLKEDGSTPILGRDVMITIGSGGTAQSCTGVTDASGIATCSILVSQPLGTSSPVHAQFDGDAYYLPSSDDATAVIFAFLDRGTFVIGDGNATISGSVTYWGAQWATSNTVSGGPAPDSFKGFGADTSPTPPAAGGTYSTRTGNSPDPPTTVPSLMAVAVSSQVSKSGSTISGDITQIVIVQTNPGYANDPGHPGTGTIVAVYP